MPKHSNNLTQQDVEKEDYQVISQKNLGNIAGQGNDAKEYRKSLIESKLNKPQTQNGVGSKNTGLGSGQASARQQSTREKDLEQKIQKLEKERKELKFESQK